MYKIMLFAAAAALAGCSQEKAAAPAEDANAVADANAAVTPAAVTLNETSWTFTRDGKAIQESIDASGNYIANAGTEHIDHGTMAMVDGKACFTSAMDQEGPVCWTVRETTVGETLETVSDKGEKLMVTRIAYTPMTMPAA